MTKKEQSMIQLVRESDVIDLTDGSELAQAARYLLNLASKALEQQSEDCVSRAEVRKIAKEMYLEVANMDLDVHTISDCISYTSSKCRQVLEKKLQALPPATSTDEGVWVEERDDYGKVNAWHCSNCYERTGFYTNYASNFCCECGVKKIGIVKSDEEAKKFLEKRGNSDGSN